MASPSRTCFIVGPIGKRGSRERAHADALFNKIIKPAFASIRKSFHVVRADHISTPGMIDSQIITHLIEARLVIADLTTRNLNAFYELGVRHMVQKPVIHIYKRGEKIPADVSLFRAVEISYSSAVAIANPEPTLRRRSKPLSYRDLLLKRLSRNQRGFKGSSTHRRQQKLSVSHHHRLRMPISRPTSKARSTWFGRLGPTMFGRLDGKHHTISSRADLRSKALSCGLEAGR